MRSFSLFGAVALAAIWVGAAAAESIEEAQASAVGSEVAQVPDSVEPAEAVAADDPFAEFAGLEDEAEAPLDVPEEAPVDLPAAPDPGTAEIAEQLAIDQDSSDQAALEPTDAPSEGMSEDSSEASTGSGQAPEEAWAEAVGRPENAEPVVETRRGRVTLGPLGLDKDGRQGRLHTVASGDTLWDIADAYLGTPWVWPSVWHENDESIANPHVIQPGDLLWITSNEMRRVTPQEATELLAGASNAQAAAAPADLTDDPAFDEQDGDLETVSVVAPGPSSSMVSIDLPADIDDGALSAPSAGIPTDATGSKIRIATRENMSFVSSETIEAASSIVESPFERTWLAQGDVVVIGMGEGTAEVGSQFTIFRDEEKVRDMDNDLVGYHIEVLGWLEVTEVHPESAVATIKTAVDEIIVTDRLVPREVPANVVTLQAAPSDLDGFVIHMPDSRTVMGDSDYVFLDRGSIHGLEVGSHLEVVSDSGIRREVVQRTRVQTPALPIAELVVVSVKPDSSVAVVLRAKVEIERGARIRAVTRDVASLN